MKNSFGLTPIKAEGSRAPYDELMREYKRKPPPKFEILTPEGEWRPATPTTQYICECGSKEFTVHFKAGGYETSVACINCHETYVVHDG